MDQQGRGEVSDAVTGAGSARCPLGVSVYDADGEQLGTVSDWQDLRNFLIVHKGHLFGHDTYIPHSAIQYSDMNGVHLRLRQCDLQGDLTSMTQPLLPRQTAPIPLTLPICVPDMGVAAVAAIAFADSAIFHAAPASASSAQSAVEAVRDHTVQAEAEAGQGIGQSIGLVPQQLAPRTERVKSRRLWRRSKR
jgi:hypothetical protein